MALHGSVAMDVRTKCWWDFRVKEEASVLLATQNALT